MNELLADDRIAAYALPALLAFVALLLLLVVRWWRSRAGDLSQVIDEIAFERIDGLILPNGDDGEIQIDHLLLTAQGLLIIHIKDVHGNVFGSDKMQEWTVIGDGRRFTFNNPQPALYDRIAAVRHIVRQVPVSGRVVFLDGAAFTKGVPSMVCTLQELRDEFIEADKSAAKFKVDAFRQHWDHLQTQSVV